MTVRAKKHLGQHFLTSEKAVREIITAAKLSQSDTVLEIGPGRGVLTRALLSEGAFVTAVEKDPEMVALLKETFAQEISTQRLRLIEADVLSFDPSSVGMLSGKYKLVANIPYYITGEIFERFLQRVAHPSLAVLLVQKEVATRIIARDNIESILSVAVKAYGSPRIISKVPRGAFSPAPKVDSAILCIDNISKDRFVNTNEEHFFRVVKAGFAHKRKTLLNNFPEHERAALISFFLEKSLNEKTRAENLRMADWFALARRLT